MIKRKIGIELVCKFKDELEEEIASKAMKNILEGWMVFVNARKNKVEANMDELIQIVDKYGDDIIDTPNSN